MDCYYSHKFVRFGTLQCVHYIIWPIMDKHWIPLTDMIFVYLNHFEVWTGAGGTMVEQSEDVVLSCVGQRSCGEATKRIWVNLKIGLFCAKTLLWSLAVFSLIWGFRSKWLTFQIKQKLRSHHFLPVKQKGCEAKMLGRPMTMVCQQKECKQYCRLHLLSCSGV